MDPLHTMKGQDSGKQTEHVFLALAILYGAIAGVVLIWPSFSTPLAIQDDARQFIFWMAEWRDDSLFQGDLLADHWRSVSPWLFVAVYRAFDLVGIEPVTTARLLPAVILPAISFFSFRFARTLTDDPKVACFAVFVVLLALVLKDNVSSATPRAFAALYLLVFLDGLGRRSIVESVIGIFLLAGTYPVAAIVGVTSLPVIFLDPGRGFRLSLSRANLVFVSACALAALLGVGPFLVAGSEFGPTVTPETARDYATFDSNGRSSLLRDDGTVNFICHGKIGLFGRCDGIHGLAAWLVTIVLAVAPILYFVRFVRSRGQYGSALPLAVCVSAVLWFVIAAILAFRLHVPNRYIIAVIPIAIVLPYGVLLGEVIRDRIVARFSGRKRVLLELLGILGITAAYLPILEHQASRTFETWDNAQLARGLMALPGDALVAGFTGDENFIPVLAQRQVLFSWELAVGYQLGYYRNVEARMRDTLEAQWTPDVHVFADKLQRNDVDALVVEADALESRKLSKSYRTMLGDFVEQKLAEYGDSPMALARLAPECEIGNFDGRLLLDVRCMIASAQSFSTGPGSSDSSSGEDGKP